MPIVVPEPSKDERTMAFLAHLLQAFSSFIGPLVIFCVRQDSRFVRFHALQCLIVQGCYMVLVFGTMFLFVGGLFWELAHHPEHAQMPPTAMLIIVPVFWLISMGGWVVNLILGVVYGLKANRGEWAGYPLIGKWLMPNFAVPAQPQPSTKIA